jgi:uncharacterized tellurite resistance protein B-like protein
MLSAIRNFFERHVAERHDEPPADAEHRARVAAAALLVEVVRGDDHFSAEERAAVLSSVERKFGLTGEESAQLLSLAEAEASGAHDFYQFTSRINASFPQERKLRLVEELWQVAYADATLHRHEEHLIRRVADLLHVPHSDFIRAKLRVQDASGGAGNPNY